MLYSLGVITCVSFSDDTQRVIPLLLSFHTKEYDKGTFGVNISSFKIVFYYLQSTFPYFFKTAAYKHLIHYHF